MDKDLIAVLQNMSANAKTPEGLANEIKGQLVKSFGLNPQYVFVWSPDESSSKGYGDAWCLCAEEGPFEWAKILTGWNEKIFRHDTVMSECYNNFIVCFYKR